MHAGVGVPVGEVVVEEADELSEAAGELVGGLVQACGPAQGGRGALVGAGGAAQAEVDPAGGERLQGAELLGDGEGAWLGSMTPPDPSRMREVCAARWARITAGEELATPGMEWCSATQWRW